MIVDWDMQGDKGTGTNDLWCMEFAVDRYMQ